MPRDRHRADDEDEDDRPARKRRRAEENEDDEEPRPKRKPRVVDEDEDEPPRRKKPRVVDEDDEDEEEDERPRRKKKKKKAGANLGLLFGLIGGGLALVLVVVLLIVFLGGGGSPKSVYKETWSNVQNKRFDRVWDNLSKTSQDQFNRITQMFPAKVGGATGKDAFIKVMEQGAMRDNPADETHNVTKEEINGDTAVLTIEVTRKSGGKSTETHRMVKENGRWKLNMGGF